MNKRLQLTISDIAFGGQGVARHEGKVYFVPFVVPGEVVTVEVTREKKKFAEAELLNVDVPSPDRVEPACPYFGRCGGCSYQHLSYPRAARDQGAAGGANAPARRPLQRSADAPDRPRARALRISQPHPCPRRRRRHRIFRPRRPRAYRCRAMPDRFPGGKPRADALRAAAVRDGDYSLRARGGGPYFEQTNPAVTLELLAAGRALVRRGQALLVDAYCGAGLFARRLAPLFEHVVGIEENEHAVANAARHALPHERYVAGDVSSLLGEVLAAHDPARTTVLLDPPATGIPPRVSDLLLGAGPAEIIYVSCNPATLARDLAGLGNAYALTSVTPLDMFPQTAEIEVVAHLTQRTS